MPTPRDEAALSRYWDALARRQRPPGDPETDPALAEAVRRLRALGAQAAPDPLFVRRLEEDLMHGEFAADGPRRWMPNGCPKLNAADWRPIKPRGDRGWPLSALALVAVIVLAFATTFAAYRLAPEEPAPAGFGVPAAQEGSPAAADRGCTVEPRTESIRDRLGTPAAFAGSPAASVEFGPEVTPNPYGILEVPEAELPTGEPAPAEAVAGIEATILEVAACADAPERQEALYSDDYFRQSTTRDEDGSIAFPPLPRKVSEARTVEIRDARLLPNGRVGAIVEGPTFNPTFVVFVEQDGRWLIDESIVITPDWFLEGEAPPGANVGVGVSASCGATGSAADIGFSTITLEGQRIVNAAIVASSDDGFVPGELEMSANDPLYLTLLNCADGPVGFVIDELAIFLTLDTGETTSISIDPEPGSYTYYSDLPGQREAGYAGTLTVVDQGTPTPCVPAAEFDPAVHECYIPDEEAAATPGAAAGDADAEAFVPTHRVAASAAVSFRAGPSLDASSRLPLPPDTPLQYLGTEAPTVNPATDGARWMMFRTEQNQEGWIREIDVEPYRT